MIGSLRGTVLDRAIGGEVLLEVGGVGYRVWVPSGAVPALEPGGPAFLFTYLVVRDDALTLYGFPDRDQRDTFEALCHNLGQTSLQGNFQWDPLEAIVFGIQQLDPVIGAGFCVVEGPAFARALHGLRC